MIEIVNKQECCGCTACAMICPKQCIGMQKDEEGFLYPVVEVESCIDCGLCNKICPISNMVAEKEEKIPKTYAMMCKDESIRRESSSGGVFTLLATEIILEQGVVFGVAMSDDCKYAAHIQVKSVKELSKLRGSKYIQSRVGEVFKEVERYLKSGRKVLFTGTPCQVEGLKAFLRKDYENLICMDIVCHGVPSEKVWNEYINYRERKAQSQVLDVAFRHKKYGWKWYSMLMNFKNRRRYLSIFTDDLYSKLFLQNLSLRPSCYACGFKKVNRVSDITVADFWGIENVIPEIDDDTGVSLVMVHTEKGEEILSKLHEEVDILQVEFSTIKENNSAISTSAKYNDKREEFFRDLGRISFNRLVKKYTIKNTTLKTEVVKLLRKTNVYENLRSVYRTIRRK